MLTSAHLISSLLLTSQLPKMYNLTNELPKRHISCSSDPLTERGCLLSSFLIAIFSC
nr:MAG TPA: hypothetical protein [Caudoviricetes sp.]